MDPQTNNLTVLTVDLLSAYVSNNSVPSEQLAALIQQTHAALVATESGPAPVEPEKPEYVPAVTPRKSLGSREHIISLIDGKPYKTLRRHLATHGLTDKEYRERYNLPSSYPMVAPAYAEHRRAIAVARGLGRKPKAAVAEAAPSASRNAPANGAKSAAAVEAPKMKEVTKAPRTAAKTAAKPKAAPKKAPAATAARAAQVAAAPIATVSAPATKSTGKAPTAKKSAAAKPAAAAKSEAPKAPARSTKPATATPAPTKANGPKAAAPAKAATGKPAPASKAAPKRAVAKKAVAARAASPAPSDGSSPTE
ncbi:hypothetical protein ACFB49_27300 [Sphingomonas sp. DBB INV C78]|uniref:MucR family transcriptional regulator n=1 Tax=Sphingomonas sp. DBB INV C78 TaxID=3349434 RepID=UPI0036D2C0A4